MWAEGGMGLRTSGFKLSIFVTLLVFVLPTGTALAQPASVAGNWLGRIVDNGLPVVVSLNIESLKLGEKTLKISYASPRNCYSIGEYAGDMDGRDIFYLTESSARTWCERFTYNTNSVIRLRLDENNNLYYEIYSVRKYKKQLEKGTLVRR